MKKDSWLIVANSSLARIFKIEKKHALVEMEVLEHPESRLHNRDLTSDKPGRDFESAGMGRHSLEPHSTPKEQEFNNFAKHIAHYLDNALNKGEFERLYISASPALLGLLRRALHPSTQKAISGELDKDMTQMKPDEIAHHLPFLF